MPTQSPSTPQAAPATQRRSRPLQEILALVVAGFFVLLFLAVPVVAILLRLNRDEPPVDAVTVVETVSTDDAPKPISREILQNCLELLPLEIYRHRSSWEVPYHRRQEAFRNLESQFELEDRSLPPALRAHATAILNSYEEGDLENLLSCGLAYYFLENYTAAEQTAMQLHELGTSSAQKSEALELAAWSALAMEETYRAQRIMENALALRSPATEFDRWAMLQLITARMQMDQQDFPRAERGMSRLVQMHLKEKLYTRPQLHLAWQHLVQAQMEQGKIPLAIKHLEVQYRILSNRLSPDHTLAMANRKTLIHALSQDERYAEALTAADDLLTRQQRVFPEMEQIILLTRNDRANLLTRTGRPTEATQELETILPDIRRVFTVDSPQVISARANLAAALAAEQSPARAESLYRELIPLSESVAGPEHPMTIDILYDFAQVLGQQNRSREAGQLALRVERLRQKNLGANHPQTRQAQEFLLNLARNTTP